MAIAQETPWVVQHRPNPEARLRLFCFPYAGGNSTLYREWTVACSADVEIGAVELPGRGTRQEEPPLTQFTEVVEAMTEAFLPLTEKDLALFGHSLGALIAFEVARSLQRRCGRPPVHLIVSGCRAPHLPDDSPDICDVEAMLTYIRALGGNPNEEMITRRWPLLQADFALRASYRYRVEEGPLSCPITAFWGERDSAASEADTSQWSVQTRHTFVQYAFPGNHFFVHQAQGLLLQRVNQCLCSKTSAKGASHA
jgi:medium-chain acyl-[acyl-carrier-protein] hydrolase